MQVETFIKKVEIFDNLQEQQGKLFPVQKVLKDIFRMDDDEIKENFKAIEDEKKDPMYSAFYQTLEEE